MSTESHGSLRQASWSNARLGNPGSSIKSSGAERCGARGEVSQRNTGMVMAGGISSASKGGLMTLFTMCSDLSTLEQIVANRPTVWNELI